MNPFFPTDFLIEYFKDNAENNTNRFQIYTVYRFLSAAAQENCAIITTLRDNLEYPLTNDSLKRIYQFLQDGVYFSPSFSENSFDTVLFCYADAIINDASGFGIAILNRILKEMCPEIASFDYSNPTLNLDKLLETKMQFYAALAVCSIHYSTLCAFLPKFAAAYRSDFQFTCEDFILYDFMDEYFQTKNVLSNPAFTELIDTLSLAVLKSFDTDLENFTLDGLFQLKHPAGRFSCLYQSGALDCSELPAPANAAILMKQILSYAAAYELRNHLYDYHLDETKTITFENWKENLKWHYVQYSNVYYHALSSFVSACYAGKLLKRDFENCLEKLKML